MKILITGATGFVGRTLIPYLFSHSLTDICLLVRDRQKAESMFPGLCLEIIATTEGEWCKQVIGYSPDVVIHMATFFTARRDDMSIEKLIGSNILFTTHLLEAVSHTSCSHFINIGTFTEFLNGAGEYLPNNLYSATKTAVRPIIRYYQAQSCWNWINVVVYSPYGRYNSSKKVIDYLVDAVKAEKPVDFSPGEGHSLRGVADMIESVWNRPVKANWGGRPYSPSDAMYAVAPINRNITLLGWKASISLKEGIRILHEDMKTYENE